MGKRIADMTPEELERKLAYNAAYRVAHREERRAYDVAYRAAHREERLAYFASYHQRKLEFYEHGLVELFNARPYPGMDIGPGAGSEAATAGGGTHVD